jgi:predicted homoserine dehydrogenase-like protein
VAIVAACPLAELTPDYSVFAKVRTREGRGYMLLKPHYFVHLEVPKTLRRMLAGGPPLITNGRAPTALIAAVAKRPIPAGTVIEAALGGFELRGEAAPIEGHADAVPITLLDGARTRHAIESGAVIREADVEVPETLARALWRRTVARVAEASHASA